MTVQDGERGGDAAIVVLPGDRPSPRSGLVRRDVVVYVPPDIYRIHGGLEDHQSPRSILERGSLHGHERTEDVARAVALAQEAGFGGEPRRSVGGVPLGHRVQELARGVLHRFVGGHRHHPDIPNVALALHVGARDFPRRDLR